MEISGTLGLTIIKTKKKYFIIFFDDHNKTSYCKNENNYFVDDFIESLLKKDKNNNICVFVEEYYNNDEYKLIWKNQHVEKLQSFVNKIKKNKNICLYPTDIRLLLIPISLEIIHNNPYYNDTKVNVFFKNVIDMFKIEIKNDKFFPDIISKLHKNIKYKIQKYIIPYENEIMKEYIKKININDIIFLLDNIMEFYSICKIHYNNSNINIIYYGLAHSLLFISILFKLYKCEIIFNNGLLFTSKNNLVYMNNFPIEKILKNQNFELFKNNSNCSNLQ